jgi:hypothetical protein
LRIIAFKYLLLLLNFSNNKNLIYTSTITTTYREIIIIYFSALIFIVKLFISYSRVDAGNFAKHIHRYLRENGHAVFIDVNSITIGDPWASSIEKNISDCDLFVFILTPDSLSSPHVEKEVLQARREENNCTLHP